MDLSDNVLDSEYECISSSESLLDTDFSEHSEDENEFTDYNQSYVPFSYRSPPVLIPPPETVTLPVLGLVRTQPMTKNHSTTTLSCPPKAATTSSKRHHQRRKTTRTIRKSRKL